jgi:hypothetical protein
MPLETDHHEDYKPINSANFKQSIKLESISHCMNSRIRETDTCRVAKLEVEARTCHPPPHIS